MRFIEDDVAPVVRALSRVPGFSGLQFHLVDVLQVMSAAKEESIHVFPFIRAGVAPTATVLSRVPGLQFDLGDVLDVMSLAKEAFAKEEFAELAKEEFAEFWRRSLAKEEFAELIKILFKLSRVPGLPLPFHLVDVLQVVAVAKEFQQDSDFQIVKAFIHADVAPAPR